MIRVELGETTRMRLVHGQTRSIFTVDACQARELVLPVPKSVIELRVRSRCDSLDGGWVR